MLLCFISLHSYRLSFKSCKKVIFNFQEGKNYFRYFISFSWQQHSQIIKCTCSSIALLLFYPPGNFVEALSRQWGSGMFVRSVRSGAEGFWGKNTVSSVCEVVELTERHDVWLKTENTESEQEIQTEDRYYVVLTFFLRIFPNNLKCKGKRHLTHFTT